MTGMAAKRPMGLIRGKVKVNESGKSKDRGNKPKWANMARMAASRPMGLISCKGKVNGLGKPKERGSKPYRPMWQK